MTARFNRFQVPKSAASDSSSHVLGMSPRRANLSEGDGTSLREFGGNDVKKDRRYSSGSAPGKSLFSADISFGNTGTTGRS